MTEYEISYTLAAMPKTEFNFLTLEEAAERLGVTVDWINKLIQRGEFPGARKVDPGKRTSPWLIPADSFLAYEKRRAQSDKD